MYRNLVLSGASLKVLALVGLALAASACRSSGGGIDDYYTPAMHYERYPIEVKRAEAKLDVSSKAGTLSAVQADTVKRFAQTAVSKSARVIHVRRPSGGGRAIAVANDIARVLRRAGISEDMIVHSTYQGSSKSPVLLSFVGSYAVTEECGSWPEDMTNTFDNEPFENFGCAQQNNIAAMVARPEDLERPRAESPSDPMRRTKMVDKYRLGDTTSSQQEQQQQVQISTVAPQ
jgi:pilus assembly protein CpaD